jgi:hypothetical protein
MQIENSPQGLARRAMNDLVLAEMFLVQATIESATAIGDGFSALGREIAQRDAPGHGSWESISGVLHRIADDALEPYTSRFRYFRVMLNNEH